jgi:hypothetical protein
VPIGLPTLQPVSWQRINDSIESVRRRLLTAASSLEKARVPCAVIGGNAVAAWVSRVDEAAVRNTRNVDLLIRREDLPLAITAMEQAGYHHRRIASLGKGGTMDVFIEGPDGKVRDAIHILFANEKVGPNTLEPSASVEESENVGEFRLISLAAWRDKDRMHLRDLHSVGLLGPENLETVPPSLRDRLAYLLDNPED